MNPLLEDWDTPFQVAPFDRISDDDFAPAFDAGLAAAKAKIDAIATSSDAPTFANTIEALEQADETLGQVLSVFYNVYGADSNPQRQELMRRFSPELAAYRAEITLNEALFARVDALWAAHDTLDLSDEQIRVLSLYNRDFVRSGAKLEGAARVRLKKVMQRLAVLGTTFTQNLLEDERSWTLPLSEADLADLPASLVASARAAGKERGADGPVITLSASMIAPFLQSSPNRALREQAFTAYVARGANGGETDNRAIAAETLALRKERASLLGYDSFAAFKLEPEMAKTPEAVEDLLLQVWAPARAKAEEDARALTKLLNADGFNGPLEPWDWRYYAEKRRLIEHDLDEAALKPYLQLERMIEAEFACAHRLFGLSFKEVDLPQYHPDVRTWEVTRGDSHMALFVGDFFARGSKRSGAWCSVFRSQQKLKGDIRPIVVNVCNFSKPETGEPALLSYDEARTLFHEFGHALHQILSDVTYERISGTSVARDFVELPSQLYEHWLEVPDVLAEFATHAETGDAMPAEMLDKVLAAATYDMGFKTVEYVASALVDLRFHAGDVPEDPMARQTEILADIGMPHAIAMRHATPHFAHVFSGDGYSSGYYSYMWSEVMDADAFQAFEEAGSAFDPETAKKLETHILSAGGSQDAQDLYLKFRGKMPDVDALLKGRGLRDAA